MSDVGVQVASNLTEELRYRSPFGKCQKPDALKRVIIEKLVDCMKRMANLMKLFVFKTVLRSCSLLGSMELVKQPLSGKLAHRYKQEGKKVMLVAADTFRAGAVAQLAEWGRRVDVPVVTGPENQILLASFF